MTFALLLFSGFAVAQTPPAKTYADLVAQAESGDPATDFTALRMAYVQSDSYDGYDAKYDALYEPLWKAVEAKDCTKVIAITDEALKIDYTLVVVHMARGDCFRTMGDPARADREDMIGRGLAHSVLSSGDGKSTATAYVVVTMDEEHLVEHYLRFREERQSLIEGGGHSYDLIEGPNDKTGEHMAVYFNVDAMFGSLTKMLGGH